MRGRLRQACRVFSRLFTLISLCIGSNFTPHASTYLIPIFIYIFYLEICLMYCDLRDRLEVSSRERHACIFLVSAQRASPIRDDACWVLGEEVRFDHAACIL